MTIYYGMMVCWVLYAAALHLRFNAPSAGAITALPFLSLLLLVGLRDPSVGTDTSGYIEEYFDASVRLRVTEFGFSYLLKFLQSLHFDVIQFLTSIALITVGSVSWLIKKYSKNIILSYILYVGFGYLAFSMSGMRQAIAISITAIALHLLIKKRPLLATATIVLASTMHNTALVFLVMIPIIGQTLTRARAITLFFILFGTALLFSDWLVVINDYLGLSYMREYSNVSSSSNPLVLLIPTIICVITLVFWPASDDNAIYSAWFLLCGAAMWFAIASRDFQMIGRLGLYFNLYSIIVLPNIIERISPTQARWLARAGLSILAVLQFAISIPGNSIGVDNYRFADL